MTIRSLHRPIILTLGALLLFSLSSCDTRPGEAAEQPAATRFVIPELKPRPDGLASGEFAMVMKRDQELRRSIDGNNRAVEPLVGLAQIFMSEARITGDHPYYYPAASRLLDEALRRDSNDLTALISKGSVLLSLHHFDEALRIAERALAISPETAIIHGIVCDASLELGRYEEAVKAADRMVAMRPDLRSYSRVSYLREIFGDESGAIEAMKMAVEAGVPGTEETEWARQTLAGLHLRRGELPQAERALMTSLAIRPDYPFALAGLARVRAAQGKMSEALALLDSAAQLIPEFSFIELQADIYRASGNDRAADSLIAVVEEMLREDEAAGHLADKEFALLYANHGIKADEAVARARKELAGRPDNIEAQHALALALLRSGAVKEAKEYIDRAMRMGTRNPEMMAHAGLIEMTIGNRERGRMLLRDAVGISPLLLGEVRRALGVL